jgi:hypothetical protein
MDKSHLLPNNPAWQEYRFTSAPTEVASRIFKKKKLHISVVGNVRLGIKGTVAPDWIGLRWYGRVTLDVFKGYCDKT